MSSTDTLLGPIGASPLDTGEPIHTFFSTGKDSDGLLFLPLFMRPRRIGFWPILKGVTSVAVCVAIYYALRRCIRYRRANRVRAQPPPLSELRINNSGNDLCNSDTSSNNTRGTWKIVPSPLKKPVQLFPTLAGPVSSHMDQPSPTLPSETATMSFGNESEESDDEALTKQTDSKQVDNEVCLGSKIDPLQVDQVHSNTPNDFSLEQNPSVPPFDLSPQDHTQIHQPECNQLREIDEELKAVSLTFTEDSWSPLDTQLETLLVDGSKYNSVPFNESNGVQIEEASKDEKENTGVPADTTIVTSSAVVTIH